MALIGKGIRVWRAFRKPAAVVAVARVWPGAEHGDTLPVTHHAERDHGLGRRALAVMGGPLLRPRAALFPGEPRDAAVSDESPRATMNEKSAHARFIPWTTRTQQCAARVVGT